MKKPDFEDQDINEFIAACAKRFCPECGKPVVQPKMGRLKIFCSDRCRWANDKRKERRKAREKRKAGEKETDVKDSDNESTAGKGFEAGGVQPEKETEAGR